MAGNIEVMERAVLEEATCVGDSPEIEQMMVIKGHSSSFSL
jgi:hypothetical protein